ncbi:putative Extracellular ligand-binding receptor [Desulfamplus magnetovallimortis]|uniref:Putative Extracellular ligand-binding receptor n=1 Tax=Desulfamplus magnetovallimortis TaxID=1246637 RepID=A0A1W1H9F4_9BACT|nr:ABC transporter substrate-binding protein [Desulfamplus magnetovallimortis]SLM29101.1 putative Extracellular ligand-binding receptor [Desulfamplus magnetovallimortis]
MKFTLKSLIESIIISSITISIFFSLTGCSREKEPVKIGFANPLSGTLSDYGLPCRRGAVLAVEKLNSSGGIKGRKIELLIKDDKNDPEEAVRVDLELVEAGVVAIIGHFTSTASMAAVPEMNKKKMLMISPGASTDQLSGIDDFFLRVIAPHTIMAEGLATEAFNSQGARNAALIFDVANRAYSENYIRAAEAIFNKLGGNILMEIQFDSKDGLSDEDINRLVKSGPDSVFVVAGALDTAMLAQEIHKRSESIKIFSSSWAMKGEFLENGGKAVEGVIISGTYDIAEDTPVLIAFKTEYENRFGEPATRAAAFGYDSVMVLKKGIEKAENLTPSAIKKAILEIELFEGIPEDFTIDKYGDPRRPVCIYEVRDGYFKIKR